MKINQYKVIETLLVALIYAIGFIPMDMRLQFLIANPKAVELLEDMAGVRISGKKAENPDQMRLFNDAPAEDVGNKRKLSPSFYMSPPASSPTKEAA